MAGPRCPAARLRRWMGRQALSARHHHCLAACRRMLELHGIPGHTDSGCKLPATVTGSDRGRRAAIANLPLHVFVGMSAPLLPSKEPGRSRDNRSPFILAPFLVISILALAASTRSAEYLAISDFASSEEYLASSSVLNPSKSTQLLHGEVREMKIEIQNLKDVGEEQLNENQPMTAEQIDDKAVIWASEHPEQHKKIQLAFIFGVVIGFVGLVVLLASEIKTVLVVRELDRDASSEAPKTYDLELAEIRWGRGFASTIRVWFTTGGLCIMLTGALVILIPLCDVLEDFGLPGAVDNDDCVTTVTIVAVVGTIALASLLVAVVWSCTRPWAALVLASISIAAQVSSAGHPDGCRSSFIAASSLEPGPDCPTDSARAAQPRHRSPNPRTQVEADARAGGRAEIGTQ